MKPNFIIIGAARSGTTSLFKYLDPHPEIFMSEIKEINFFSNEKFWCKGFNWYESHFASANQKRIGEASTSYTSYPSLDQTAERIFKYAPDIKLIYVLRDPIDRFISHYLHRVSRGVESRDIELIVENHKEDFLLTQGKYYLQLEQYLQFFPIEQIHLLTIENLKDQAAETVKSIYKFLEIDQNFSESKPLVRHNVNSKVTRKNKFGKFILNVYHNNIEQVAYPYSFKKIFLRVSEIGATEIKPPSLDNQTLNSLKKYYSDDINKLSQLTSLDLGEWRNYND